jgi:hypothetical protein
VSDKLRDVAEQMYDLHVYDFVRLPRDEWVAKAVEVLLTARREAEPAAPSVGGEGSAKPRNAWDIESGPHKGKRILLLTPTQLHALPPDTIVTDIFGRQSKSGIADDDTRYGYTAFGFVAPTAPVDEPKAPFAPSEFDAEDAAEAIIAYLGSVYSQQGDHAHPGDKAVADIMDWINQVKQPLPAIETGAPRREFMAGDYAWISVQVEEIGSAIHTVNVNCDGNHIAVSKASLISPERLAPSPAPSTDRAGELLSVLRKNLVVKKNNEGRYFVSLLDAKGDHLFSAPHWGWYVGTLQHRDSMIERLAEIVAPLLAAPPTDKSADDRPRLLRRRETRLPSRTQVARESLRLPGM